MKKKIKKRWIILGIIVVLILVNVIRGKINEATKGKGFEMPDTDIAKMLPDPGSNYGEVIYSSEDGFSVNIYKYSKDDYRKYVKECAKAGFDVDAKSSDTMYTAENDNEYSLGLFYYEDSKEMSLSLKTKTIEQDNTENQSSTDDTNTSGTEDTQTDNSTADNGDIRPEIKEAIDSYESFMNEYVEFMKKYESSNDVASLAAQYTEFASKYADVESKFDALENDDLNDAETTYYIEVQTRINNKLLEINQQ